MYNKLIILDLDETLLHATCSGLDRESELLIGSYAVYIRPHANEFIEFCFQNFAHVAVWTSATMDYAVEACEYLFEENYERLEFIWARERCTRRFNSEYFEWDWIKDLKKVKKKGFTLDKVIMIDNTPGKLRRQYGNLVRVKDFEGCIKDNELVLLMRYLPLLGEVDNIRVVEKRGWRNKFSENINIEKI